MSLQSDPARAEARPDSQTLDTVLVRVNARAWGLATGLLLGLGLFVLTNVLVLRGGQDVGMHLGRLSQVLPGYDVSFVGSLVGFVYAFVIGYALGRLLGPRHPVARPVGRTTLTEHPPIRATTWGLGLGVLPALALFALTNVLVLRGGDGEEVGPLLAQLQIYFPGFTVSFVGSLIGAAYLFVLGFLVGRSIGALYNRLVAPHTP